MFITVVMVDGRASSGTMTAGRPMTPSSAIVEAPERHTTRCEAAMRFGWDRWLGDRGGFVGMTGFGASAPYKALYKHFGITAEAVVKAAKERL